MRFFNFFGIITFIISVSSIFLQFFSNFFSNLISPMIIVSTVFFLLSNKINKKNLKLIVPMILILSLNLFFSVIVYGNTISNAARFFLVLIVILISITIKPNTKIITFFLAISVLFTIFLIYKEFYYVLRPGQWIVDRKIWGLNGIGDVYSYNNWFYRIQVKGNALVPVSFFVTFYYVKEKKIRVMLLLLFLVGIIIAGNTMFIIGLIVFYFMDIFFLRRDQIKKLTLFRLILILVGLIGIFVMIFYLIGMISLKQESSIPTRIDQLNVLMQNYSDTLLGTIFGKGLGNVLINVVTPFRDYSGDTYFELQVIYIINQIGIFVMMIYLFIYYELIKNNWKSKCTTICLIAYLVYAVSNPYIFDVTNIIVVLLLSSLDNHLKKEKESLVVIDG